jgi:hypothetical protein
MKIIIACLVLYKLIDEGIYIPIDEYIKKLTEGKNVLFGINDIKGLNDNILLDININPLLDDERTKKVVKNINDVMRKTRMRYVTEDIKNIIRNLISQCDYLVQKILGTNYNIFQVKKVLSNQLIPLGVSKEKRKREEEEQIKYLKGRFVSMKELSEERLPEVEVPIIWGESGVYEKYKEYLSKKLEKEESEEKKYIFKYILENLSRLPFAIRDQERLNRGEKVYKTRKIIIKEMGEPIERRYPLTEKEYIREYYPSLFALKKGRKIRERHIIKEEEIPVKQESNKILKIMKKIWNSMIEEYRNFGIEKDIEKQIRDIERLKIKEKRRKITHIPEELEDPTIKDTRAYVKEGKKREMQKELLKTSREAAKNTTIMKKEEKLREMRHQIIQYILNSSDEIKITKIMGTIGKEFKVNLDVKTQKETLKTLIRNVHKDLVKKLDKIEELIISGVVEPKEIKRRILKEYNIKEEGQELLEKIENFIDSASDLKKKKMLKEYSMSEQKLLFDEMVEKILEFIDLGLAPKEIKRRILKGYNIIDKKILDEVEKFIESERAQQKWRILKEEEELIDKVLNLINSNVEPKEIKKIILKDYNIKEAHELFDLNDMISYVQKHI